MAGNGNSFCSSGKPGDVAPRRILLADDEPLVRDLLVRFLRQQGHEVVVARDGREALESFKAQPADLVLSDVRMPRLDGLQLLHAIKDINPRVPVVLISGYGDVETVVNALKSGAENFLAKPLDMAVLGKVIDQALSLTSPQAPLGRNLRRLRQWTSMEVASQPEYICEVLYLIAQSGVAVGFAEHDLDANLKLALVEAVTNAMEHGNRWDPGLVVKVSVEATPEELSVTVEDQGQGFKINSLADPTRGDQLMNERGRGVFLMQVIMDEVVFNPQGNRVCLRKHRGGRPAGAN